MSFFPPPLALPAHFPRSTYTHALPSLPSMHLPHPFALHIKEEAPTPYAAAQASTNPAAPADDKQERELLRKVSHSAIERRRRERINDKIMQLKTLVPACAAQENIHKLSILQGAIEYIRVLQDELAVARGEVQQSEPVKRRRGSVSSESSVEHEASRHHPYGRVTSPSRHRTPPSPPPSVRSFGSDAGSVGAPSPVLRPAYPAEEVDALLLLASASASPRPAQRDRISVGSLLC
ncbi:hypothetical protein BDK51DRAFT_47560 [Blyttiomyces helicus]|uniref:BHLH domain-containing protein n=1 Tax=Blyttiomyces helicus TaxID=388810 RepID=A0A4P9VXH7_9FUNG|nr:hypothetical protein BDK51DRAFT_47560 [Blyttiomyces helicus]|eukprot:RKO84441.1 hypothetical protein BDK51DRAFT_47560 [Blyttiomyces helicus]